MILRNLSIFSAKVTYYSVIVFVNIVLFVIIEKNRRICQII